MLGRISWFFSHLGGTCGSRSTLLFYLAADHQIVINGSIFPIFSQQVGNFSETLVLFLPPLVPLPRDDFVWEWTGPHDRDCKVAQESLFLALELSFNNPASPTSLHDDASHLRVLGLTHIGVHSPLNSKKPCGY